MKYIATLFYYLIIPTLSIAQSDSTHWTQQMNQPQVNYYKIKAAFEKEQKQSLDLFKVNNPSISKDSLAILEATKEGFYNIFKRWEYFIIPRIDKEGNFNAAKESQTTKAYLDNLNIKKNRPSNIANWQALGPFKSTTTTYANNGRVECVAFHPTDVNTFYIGAPSGGVWKTTNGGTAWQYLSQNWNDQNVTGLAVNPTNPNIIFALKQNNYMLKSTDAGATWTQINTPGYSAINKILFHPTNSQIMIANVYFGILRSIDGGSTWSFISVGSSAIEDIKFKPNDPNTVYATSVTNVYKSTNGGLSFSSIFALPSNSIAANIAVTAAEPNSLYVAYNSNISINIYYRKFGAIYKSTDSGSTFTTITNENTPVETQTMGDLGAHQGRYDLTLAVSPTDANDIWLGIVPAFRTTNGGASWVYSGSNNVSVHVDHHAAEYQPISGKLFIGCDGGLYKFTPSSNTYEILEGMNITQIYRIGGLKNSSSKIVYGAQDNGTHKWESSIFKDIFGGDGMECIIDHTNNNIIYGSYQYGSLIKSTDNGNSSTGISPNPLPSYTQWVTPWEMDPSNSQILYACYNEVYKTTNGGTSWTAITNFNLNQGVRFIKIAPSNSSILYTFSTNFYSSSILQKSTNGGSSWTTLNLPSPNYFGYDLAINATDPNKIYFVGGGKTYSSTDGGISWTNTTGSLPGTGTNCIVQDKYSNDLYLGTSMGVFVRPAAGTDWIYFNDGFPKINIQELEISYVNGNILRAGTYGRGLWETTLYTPCSTPIATITPAGSAVLSGGSSVSLQANIGSGLSYQWFKNGIQIVGSTNSIYVANDIGDYTVLVQNSDCSKFSSPITITTSAILTLDAIPAYICKGTLSIPFTATNFAAGTTFTAEIINTFYQTEYIQFSTSGTTSPLTINIPTYYNLPDIYKIRIKASSLSLSDISSSFRVKSVDTGIGNENGNVFGNGTSYVYLCPGKTTKLFALKFNNTMPSSTFSYQWKLNGTNIAGATDSTLTLNQAGLYSVVMSQPGCTTTLTAVNISTPTYITPILRTPISNTQCTNVLLETFYNTPTAVYQWKKDGTVIPTANKFFYNATASGAYTLTVTDGSGCTINPVSREVKIGKLQALITSTDSVVCSTNGYAYIYISNTTSSYDNPPYTSSGITYQWQRNGQDIAQNATLNYYYTPYSQDGIYTVKIKQQNCESVSNPFYVKTSSTIPVYTKSYSGYTACTGQTITLYGSGTGSFVWQRDGVDVQNSNSYNATTTGSYTLKRTQGSCMSTSAPIALTFSNSFNPIITGNYNQAKACNYAFMNASSMPSGSTFQWRKNGVNIPSTNNNYYLSNTSGSYDLVVTNGTCNGISNAITITIGSIEAEINEIYQSLYCRNSVKKLSLGKLNYDISQIQWKKNGIAILGATQNDYLADAPGNYTASIIQNTCTYETSPFNVPARLFSTGTLSGNTTITGGQTGTITANLTGISPWAVTLSDGIVRYSITTPFNISVSPISTQTYTIQSMSDGCNWGCIPTWNITAPSSVNSDKYHASQNINSISNISSPTNMEYKAGNNILLSPGFKVQNGATFKAEIGGCN